MHPALAAALLLLAAQPARAPVPAATLEPETSDTASLPPPSAHRVWVYDIYSGSAVILDGDTGAMQGTIHSAGLSDFASAPGQREIYVAESIWSKGNRGTRQDMVTVYDGSTLNLKTEIAIPGRIYMAPRPQLFALNPSGDRGYIYNAEPAASVVVVDLKAQKVARSVDTPGCALVFPFGERGFASLCGNGALATVPDSGSPTLTRSKPFFDAEKDPVFQESPSDPASGRTLFVSYSGRVFPVRLAAAPAFDAPWSLQEGAGLKAASFEDGTTAWLPGGRLPLAWRRSDNRLYVLMHAGEPWSHKKLGTELWMVDGTSHKVLRRQELATPGDAIAVSQDDRPLIFVVDAKGALSIRDALTLRELRTVEKVGYAAPMVPGL